MNQLRNAFAMISVLALGGCQFFGNMHVAHNAQIGQPAEASASALPAAAIQEGREHLRGNRTGLAIEAFNRALASGEDPALAYNGLGVAYARLGRPELAYRFFKKAAMSDPANPMFAHNLAALVNSPAFTLDQMTRLAPALAIAPARQADAATAAALIERTPGKLYRDSNRQFSLRTAAPEPARAAPSERRAALGDCSRPSSSRTKRHCLSALLPEVQSRTRRTLHTAFNAAFPTSQVPTAALSDQPLDAPTGKRKSVDLRGPLHNTSPARAPQRRIPAASNAAT